MAESTINTAFWNFFSWMIIYFPLLFFKRSNALNRDNQRGYKAFKALSIIYGKRDKRFVDKSIYLSENFQSTINTAFQSFFLKSTIYGKRDKSIPQVFFNYLKILQPR